MGYPSQGMTDPVARADIADLESGATPAGVASALAAGATMADDVTGVAPADQALATTLAALGIRRRAITGANSLAASDLGGVVDATSGTFALTAPSSLGASFWCFVLNSGTGTVTFTPSGGAATVDGAATFALVGRCARIFFLDTVTAGAWKSIIVGMAGHILIPSGTVGLPGLAFEVDKTTGIYTEAAGRIRFGTGGSIRALIDSGGLTVVGALTGNGGGSTIYQFSANVLNRTSDSSESSASLGSTITNAGAGALVSRTLPSAAAGYWFEFAVLDADGLKIVANTGDDIRVIDKITATAGYISSTTIGSVVRLVAMDATTWVATYIHGVWTDGTFTYDDTSLTSP